MTDYGFSAEAYSRAMSAGLGREYRAFNFSTGTAAPVTLPKLYRLVRTVARPRSIVIVFQPEPRRPAALNERSPDYILARAPVGASLSNQALLNLDKALWSLPLARFASPLRDSLLYGANVDYRQQAADWALITPSGDSVGYTYTTGWAEIERGRQIAGARFPLLSPEEQGTLAFEQHLGVFYNDGDRAAIRELRGMAEADGCEIVVVAHAQAATYFGSPNPGERFRRTAAQQLAILARALDARLVTGTDRFAVPWYAIMDRVHLNQNGAVPFARLAARMLLDPAEPAGVVEPYSGWSAPSPPLVRPDDRSINYFAAAILRPDRPRARPSA